jgi:hypothetical protein
LEGIDVSGDRWVLGFGVTCACWVRGWAGCFAGLPFDPPHAASTAQTNNIPIFFMILSVG